MNHKLPLRRGCLSILSILLCILFLSGCGRSLVITTGFGRGEVFRIGNTGCKIGEVRVYMLDLQKQSEAMYGNAIWESEAGGTMQQAVKDQALSQITRIKALNRIGVSRNVMLTMDEERLAEEAEHTYYAGLSSAEQKYLGLDEKNLQRMFREYSLADKTWRSLGESAEAVYNDYIDKTQCDLNTRYWQKVTLERLEGDLAAPGFLQCCADMLDARDRAQQQAPAEAGAADTGTTADQTAPAAETPADQAAPAAETPADQAAPAVQTPADQAVPAAGIPADQATPAAQTPADQAAPASAVPAESAEAQNP